MDENRVEGTARNLGGKVQEGFGKVTGNARTQAEGLADQFVGRALHGQRHMAILGRARRAAGYTIQTQPVPAPSGTRDRMAPRSLASAIVIRHR